MALDNHDQAHFILRVQKEKNFQKLSKIQKGQQAKFEKDQICVNLEQFVDVETKNSSTCIKK